MRQSNHLFLFTAIYSALHKLALKSNPLENFINQCLMHSWFFFPNNAVCVQWSCWCFHVVFRKVPLSNNACLKFSESKMRFAPLKPTKKLLTCNSQWGCKSMVCRCLTRRSHFQPERWVGKWHDSHPINNESGQTCVVFFQSLHTKIPGEMRDVNSFVWYPA